MDTSIRVLVVDDSSFYAQIVADTLATDYDMTTMKANDARNGLDRLDSADVDCVVTDYQMPEMNGIEFLEAARERGFEQPFILLTGTGSEAVASEAVAAGVTHYFQKEEGEQQFEKLANQIDNAVEQRRTEQKYELLVNNSPDLIAQLNADGEFVMANAAMAEALDSTPTALTDQSLFDVVPEDVAERRLEIGREVIETGETRRFEDGYEGEYFHNVFASVDLPGERETFQVITRDITDRKEAEIELKETVEKLEESNAQLEQFAYVTSHDLQEPLRMVSSYMQLLERGYKDDLDEDAQEFIDYAVDGADRMKEMINDLLKYSRVDSRGGEFERTDFESVVEQATDNLQMAVHESGAEVTHDPLPSVVCDESQMVVLLQNLVGNAIKYCDEETPRIHVSAERDDEEYVFSVSDNGIGIPEDDADEVFRIFSRLHGNDEYSGTGIGLAMCQKILDRHEGDIWLESEVGEGSTFYFALSAGGAGDE
ncbi:MULTISPECIES: ATP-binding protein [Halorussus]|uniref:sensor histidine kinase n=1 Tax=Halorussus TaxID=1070314 RepID=UPI0013B3715F|nr:MULTISPECIES: ATP-binding protein [Halorussus]NHN59964.1 response regulator [Halorussus sp. JP-T4]